MHMNHPSHIIEAAISLPQEKGIPDFPSHLRTNGAQYIACQEQEQGLGGLRKIHYIGFQVRGYMCGSWTWRVSLAVAHMPVYFYRVYV
jgi:hypothetical protein